MSKGHNQRRLEFYKIWASLPEEKRDTNFIVVGGTAVVLQDHNRCNGVGVGIKASFWSEFFSSPNFNTETGEYSEPRPVFERHEHAVSDEDLMLRLYGNKVMVRTA